MCVCVCIYAGKLKCQNKAAERVESDARLCCSCRLIKLTLSHSRDRLEYAKEFSCCLRFVPSEKRNAEKEKGKQAESFHVYECIYDLRVARHELDIFSA